MMTSKVHFLIALSICFTITGCATQLSDAATRGSPEIARLQPSAEAQQENITVYKYQVFFGLSKPSGGAVSLAEWAEFVTGTIAPEFYSGFTVLDATGFYRGKPERSKVLTLIVNAGDVDTSIKKIRTISRSYADKFGQNSVMLTKAPVLEWNFIDASK